MLKRFDVYIAGAMHGRKVRDVLIERARAKDALWHLGISYYDPADDEGLHKRGPESIIDLRPSYTTMTHFVEKDEKHLSQCKNLLVLTGDKSSSGTGWEMAMAHYALKIPIVIVAPKMAAGRLMNFTTVKANVICKTVEDAALQIYEYL